MQSGSCVGFTCTSCSTSAAYTDGSACVPCGGTTSGLSPTTQDCTCAASGDGYYYNALLETDATGTYLSSKACGTCPTGEFVVTTADVTVGMYVSVYVCV